MSNPKFLQFEPFGLADTGLLEGSVTLTDDAGQEHHFQAGDAVYVPQGAKYGWKNKDYMRKFYAIFEPSGAGIAR